MKPLTLVTDLLVAAFAALQLALAVAVAPKAWWIAALFAAAAAVLLLGLIRRDRAVLIGGITLAVGAPLAVGLSGVEPFDIRHHLVRLAVVAVMLFSWHLTHPRSASAPSPEPQA